MSALRRQISQVFTLIGMIRLLESKDILTFRLFLRALSFESSRRTTHNILLLRRIRTLVETMEPKFLFLTAEGQPFESLVIRMRDLHFPKMRICYVQHSPIVPGQMELFENLSLLRKGDLVEVTGVYYKELFSYYNRDLEFKFKKTSSPQTLNQNEFTVNDIHILGAPEASFSSTLRFLLLFCELSTKFREWTFVIRFHPDLRRQGLMKNIFPRFCRNLYFSNQSLHFDLQTSNFVIFRSSSVGIEALGFGVIPIHISFENSRLLNPLQNTFFDRFSFNETQSIIDFFSQFQDSKADLRKLQLNSASTYRLFRSY
jgi:hypothetical protein